MDAHADSRSLHDGIGQRRDSVSPLQQVIRQAPRARCEHWNDRGAQATIRDRSHRIGCIQRKDGLRHVLQGNK